MIQHYVKLWNERKHILEEHFKETDLTDDYDEIVKALFEYVLIETPKQYPDKHDVDNMVIIDHGSYQGTRIYFVPFKTYQPTEKDYIYLGVDYGSCSGCDALQSICRYEYNKPNDEQLKDLMMLCLHLVQSIKYLEAERSEQ